MLGITKEYTTGDKVIAWGFFLYSFVWGFVITVLFVIIWKSFYPLSNEWWGDYFFIVYLVVPGIMAFISTFWFGIGGVVDLRRLFRDLKERVTNDLDNGQVDGHVSLADKAEFEKLEHELKEHQKDDDNSEKTDKE
jgi:hypothetical protein